MATEHERGGPCPSVSVVMPALDEAEGIGLALRQSLDALDLLVDDRIVERYEILVVDDGSTDGTAELVRDRAATRPDVHLLAHDRNRGVGAALRTGIEAASGDLVLYTDADMPVDLGELRRALPHLDVPDVGMVVGHRTSFDLEPRRRRFASLLYDHLARACFAITQPDVNFPFKLISTDLARKLDLRSDGALIDIELLAKAQADGRTIVSIPMDYHARVAGESKTMRATLLGRLAVEMVRHARSIRPERRR